MPARSRLVATSNGKAERLISPRFRIVRNCNGAAPAGFCPQRADAVVELQGLTHPDWLAIRKLEGPPCIVRATPAARRKHRPAESAAAPAARDVLAPAHL